MKCNLKMSTIFNLNYKDIPFNILYKFLHSDKAQSPFNSRCIWIIKDKLKIQIYFLFFSFKKTAMLKQHKSWAWIWISNHTHTHTKNIIFPGIVRGVERQYKINNVTYSKISKDKNRRGNVEKMGGRKMCGVSNDTFFIF